MSGALGDIVHVFRLLVSVCSGLAFLSPALSQNNQGFVATRSIGVGGIPWSSAVGDFNHDGIPDIAVANGNLNSQVGNTVAVVLGVGNGKFHSVVQYPTNQVAQFVSIADVNGDGDPDIVVASYVNDIVTPVGVIEVLMGKGDGTFAAAVDYTIPGAYPRAIYPGDFNGDGHVDVAVAVTTTDSNNITLGLAIFMNNRDGTLRLTQAIPDVCPFGTADFNRDGKLDLLVGNFSGQFSHSVSILFGAGDGTFAHAGPVITLSSPINIVDAVISDFNGDGYPDVAVINGGVTVLLSRPDGSFTQAAPSPSVDNGLSAVAGDFNHDGHMDLAVITGFAQAQVNVLLGHGDGTFFYRSIYGTDGANGYGPGAIRAADLNQDGYLDLVTVNSGGTLSPMYGKPGGTFNAEVTTGPGWNNSVATVTGDFNGDGIPDVAVMYTDGLDHTRGTVSIYQGQKSGHFKPLMIHYPTGTAGSGLAAGDVNGDGKMDLVVNGESNIIGSQYGLLLGRGDATFAPVRALNLGPTGCCQSKMYLVDINHDHKLDIVSSDGVSQATVTVRFSRSSHSRPLPKECSSMISRLAISMAMAISIWHSSAEVSKWKLRSTWAMGKAHSIKPLRSPRNFLSPSYSAPILRPAISQQMAPWASSRE